jgi:hypothetical protein
MCSAVFYLSVSSLIYFTSCHDFRNPLPSPYFFRIFTTFNLSFEFLCEGVHRDLVPVLHPPPLTHAHPLRHIQQGSVMRIHKEVSSLNIRISWESGGVDVIKCPQRRCVPEWKSLPWRKIVVEDYKWRCRHKIM